PIAHCALSLTPRLVYGSLARCIHPFIPRSLASTTIDIQPTTSPSIKFRHVKPPVSLPCPNNDAQYPIGAAFGWGGAHL
ncbi:hypothetical protein BD779DRAFT_1551813, partial [Infundibulicybe gibba]